MLSGIVSVTLAAFVYLSRPHRVQNRFLAAFLLCTGLAWFLHKGLAPIFTAPAETHASLRAFLFIHWTAHLFHFLFVTTLDSPLCRPLARPWVRWLATVLLGSAAVSSAFVPGWTGPVMRSFVHDGWWGTPGPIYLVASPVFILLFLYGFAAGLSAWRRSEGATARRQNGAYFLAFAAHDGGMALMLVVVAATGAQLGPALVEHMFHWIPPLVNIWMVTFLTYGILTTQLFDIDVRLRVALSRSTVAATIALAFLVASEAVERLLPIDGTFMGIAAAVGVALMIRPVQSFSERLATRLLPIGGDEETYLDSRRVEVYRAAVEGAVRDGRITIRERDVLARLSASLGLAAEDATRIERETLGAVAD